MSWTTKYWDAVAQLYWDPKYIGLKSIPQSRWEIEGDRVSVPRELTNPSGPLYFRLRSAGDYWEYMRRQEEPFNHIFDLTFAILPGDVVSEIFADFSSAGKGNNYRSYGRELRERYFGSPNANVTNPDGFFIAEASILGVELKFNAKTSLGQLAKYLLLFAMEERLTGQRQHVDLVYVFPADATRTLSKQLGASIEEAARAAADLAFRGELKGKMLRLCDSHEAELRSVASRLNLNAITWERFLARIRSYSSSLGDGSGDRTIKRLLAGLASEIRRHPLAGVDQ